MTYRWPWRGVQIGHLFGGSDEIFAVASEEEHSYNVETEIWLLPAHGKPELLLSIQGIFKHFSAEGVRQVPGVTIMRQTYDGVHSETKGAVKEFYRWDRIEKSLKQEPRQAYA
jgi:hypothetical protein